MKVGDLVRQCSRVVKFKGKNPPKQSKRIGIVLAIHEDVAAFGWAKVLGRTVEVLWDNGNLTKNFAENSLEVISHEEG
jgi:hypothetical protein